MKKNNETDSSEARSLGVINDIFRSPLDYQDILPKNRITDEEFLENIANNTNVTAHIERMIYAEYLRYTSIYFRFLPSVLSLLISYVRDSDGKKAHKSCMDYLSLGRSLMSFRPMRFNQVLEKEDDSKRDDSYDFGDVNPSDLLAFLVKKTKAKKPRIGRIRFETDDPTPREVDEHEFGTKK